jgi:hypothetical protein
MNNLEKSKILGCLRKVVLFPGSIAEYERTFGYPVEVINTKIIDKGVDIFSVRCRITGDLSDRDDKYKDFEGCKGFAEYLFNEGIEALVNHNGMGYGLPVRKSR